jgi:hypothetical protein
VPEQFLPTHCSQTALLLLHQVEDEERGEREARQAWALHAIEEERQRRTGEQFLEAMATTAWFADTISSFCAEYEIVCPYRCNTAHCFSSLALLYLALAYDVHLHYALLL